MVYRVELHPAAIDDAQAVYDHIVRNSPQSAREFAEAFDHAIRDLAETAHTWDAKASEKKYLLNRFRVSLIYRIRDRVVIVGAVAHQRRRPGYWTERKF